MGLVNTGDDPVVSTQNPSWLNGCTDLSDLEATTKKSLALPCSFAVELTLMFGQDEVPYPAALIEALKRLPNDALVYEINIQPGHTTIKCTKEDTI